MSMNRFRKRCSTMMKGQIDHAMLDGSSKNRRRTTITKPVGGGHLMNTLTIASPSKLEPVALTQARKEHMETLTLR